MLIRLACAFIAAFIIGMDRGEHGHTVGLRTTLLVCLASCLAMLQASSMVALTGRAADSFIQLDAMRLPLEILSGIGFIGGDAILKKGSLVAGVTTAATLWFVTVIGLCFGGGELAIGWAGTGLGLFCLLGLRHFDRVIPREMLGILSVHLDMREDHREPLLDQLQSLIAADEMRIDSLKIAELPTAKSREFEWKIAWKKSGSGHETPLFVGQIADQDGIAFVQWDPQGG